MTPVPMISTDLARVFRRSLSALCSAMLSAATVYAQTPPPAEAKPAAPAATPAAPDTVPAEPGTQGAPKRPRRAAPPSAPAAQETIEPSPLEPLAWLEGCWVGTVNQREVREHWMPLRGNLLLGMSQTVMKGKTQDFEYLRIESRPDGIYYLNLPSGQNGTTFKYAGQTVITLPDRNDDAFVFTNAGVDFPQKLTYRRATEGWLYVAVEGKLKGMDKEVTYPLRHIDCQSGKNLTK